MIKRLVLTLSIIPLFATGIVHGESVGSLDSGGKFSGITPGSVASISGLDTNEVRWGNPVGGGENSGYRFDGVASQAVTGDGSFFPLGDFSHINEAIFLPSITNADLDISLDFLSDGSPFSTSFPLVMNHNETPNSPPCNPSGATICPDIVTFSSPPSAVTVSLGGESFVFDILGFSQDGGNTITNEFLTEEGMTNTATLYASLTPVVPVPLPPAVGLMGMGLVGMIGIMRRRKHGKVTYGDSLQ
jgi:hypothetical protein